MKKLILTLACLGLLSIDAFAGIKDVTDAFTNKDYATAISKADEVLADENEGDMHKAAALCCKGESLYYQGDCLKAIVELQKVLDNFPTTYRSYTAEAELYIGFCYERLKDRAKAQEKFLKVAREYPELGWARWAVQKINFTLMSNEEAVTILERVLRGTPATAKNAEVLGKIKSELEKYK